MKRKKSIRMLFCVALSIFVVGYLAATAEAVPITYIFGGSNSSWEYDDGLGGGGGIDNVSFRIYLVGDTDFIDTISDPFNLVTGTIFLYGLDPALNLGSTLQGVFLDPLAVYVTPFIAVPPEDSYAVVGFDDLSANLFDIASTDPALLSYLLTAPFGPIPGFVGAPGTFNLDIGTLDFNDSLSVFFEARLGDTTPVPEPVSMLLLGIGLLGVSALRRRKS